MPVENGSPGLVVPGGSGDARERVSPPERPRRQWAHLHRLSVIVILVGLVATLTGALAAAMVNNRSEQRLLELQVRAGSAALDSLVSEVQNPLDSAATLAGATGGSAEEFTAVTEPYLRVGLFESASLWRLGSGSPALLDTLGTVPYLAHHDRAATRFFTVAQAHPQLAVGAELWARAPFLSFAAVSSGPSPYAIEVQWAVPPDHRVSLPPKYGFSDLRFAVYLGRSTTGAAFIEGSTSHLPLTGRTAKTTVPIGDTVLTVVATPKEALAGSLSEQLPWIIVVVGVIMSALAGTMTEWLVRRRTVAEALAVENRQLYAEQRGIAEVLQHALLPEALPAIAGMEIGVRYVTGEVVEVGGDWYDVIDDGDGSFLFVVGDVSGHGIRAATEMAALHHGIRAYRAEGHPPAEILTLLGSLIDIKTDDHFATVLCGHVDVAGHTVTLATAGHLPPLVIDGPGGHYPEMRVGPPVGVAPGSHYRLVDLTVGPGATVLAFTDGLIERRGESLDAGLERLRARGSELAAGGGSLDALLTAVVADLLAGGSDDDTAILGLRWRA